MNLSSVMQRAKRLDLHWVLGRFKTVRRTYSGARHVLEISKISSTPPRPVSLAKTLFPTIHVGAAVQAVRDDAVFLGLNLPIDVVAEIKNFALTEPLHAIYDPTGPTFLYSEVSNGRASDGRPIPVAGVRDPARCSAVRAVIDDPVLRAIVRSYLGHEPRTILPLLSWTFASSMSDDERRRLRHHVIDYHYDVEGFNFVYANFYITDTDRHSGAHVMMKRSHDRKPLRMLLGSVKASEASVRAEYGRENELVIEGAAGTGFVQDTSCYHRASSPTRGDRLMLALRFIN